MDYICFFNEQNAADLTLVGGKGTNLGKMSQAGFPVPPGFCITAEAYRYLVNVTGLGPIIERFLDAIDFENPACVEEKALQIRELITQQPIPMQIAAEIETAYEQLGLSADKNPDPMHAVAVRSSATAEDLPDASFAGQQDTFLNIRGCSSLLEHVRCCWGSLWTARAITYRQKQGYDHKQVHLAVVVQSMIDPDISGVAFTANPINGSHDECVINASWGLGEAIVSGAVSPDTYVVSKADGRIVHKQIACKERVITSNANGGAIEMETPANIRSIPSLTDRQAADLTALSCRIEDHYGQPQDIEWANLDSKWYILQSRPITTLNAAPTITLVPGKFSRAMFVEIFPQAISPSFLSVVTPLLANMLDYTFKQLGMKPPEDMEAVNAFNNQPYFNVDYIEAAFSRLPAVDREPLVAQFVNPFASSEEKGRTSLAQFKLLARMLLYHRRFRRQLSDSIGSFRADVAALNALPLHTASDQEIVRQISTLVFQGASRLLNGDFLLIALAGTFSRLVQRILEPIYGDRTSDIFNSLITGVTGNVIMETNKLVLDLAQEASADAEVKEALLLEESDQVMKVLRQTDTGQKFLDRLSELLDVCGHREIVLDILYPTWGEDPTPVLAYIRGYIESESAYDLSKRQALLVEEREELTREVLTRLRSSLTGRFIYSPIFSWLLRQIHHLLRERDTMHFEWTRLFPPSRKLLLELGRRWSAVHLFNNSEDIFYLQLDEMDKMAREQKSALDLISRRRQELAANLHGPWPEIIEDGQELSVETAGGSPDRLQGVAGSPGTFTGRCRIIRGPQDFGRLESGDILVAPLTNPVWTPLFAIAGALVTDVGGILSHGAIVAREYGIPAVMSVSGATVQLVDDQIITVDGSKGMVYTGQLNGMGKPHFLHLRTNTHEVAQQ